MNDYENLKNFFIINLKKIIGAIIGFVISILAVKYGFWKMIAIVLTTIIFSILFDNLPKGFSIKKIIIRILTKGEDY